LINHFFIEESMNNKEKIKAILHEVGIDNLLDLLQAIATDEGNEDTFVERLRNSLEKRHKRFACGSQLRKKDGYCEDVYNMQSTRNFASERKGLK